MQEAELEGLRHMIGTRSCCLKQREMLAENWIQSVNLLTFSHGQFNSHDMVATGSNKDQKVRQKGAFDGCGGKIAMGCDRRYMAICRQKMNEYTGNRLKSNLFSFSLSFSLLFPPFISFLSFYPFFSSKRLRLQHKKCPRRGLLMLDRC